MIKLVFEGTQLVTTYQNQGKCVWLHGYNDRQVLDLDNELANQTCWFGLIHYPTRSNFNKLSLTYKP